MLPLVEVAFRGIYLQIQTNRSARSIPIKRFLQYGLADWFLMTGSSRQGAPTGK